MIVTTNLAKGAVAMARHKTIVKRLNAIQNFGAMDVLCTDKTGTLTQDKVVLERHINVVGEEDDWVLALAYLNSFYQTGLKNLLDVAVLEHGELARRAEDRQGVRRRSTRSRSISRAAACRWSWTTEHEHHQLICKGAVEEMLAVCTRVHDEDRVVELTAERREDAKELVAELNEDGFRVVAVAYRDFDRAHGPYTVRRRVGPDPRRLHRVSRSAEGDGGAGAPGARATRRHGEDSHRRQRPRRAQGLPRRRPRRSTTSCSGASCRRSTTPRVGEIAERDVVFAKLTPDEKVRIVRALRARGHTVGFMGDGINDAGALREADVGISVDSAVDIAKESADIILLEKSLLVLEDGVIEGRKTFGNTIKYIKMTASSNFGNVFSVLVASAFLPFLPMLPIQLLTVNLLYDFSQASIPWDEMDPGVPHGAAQMARRRHRPLHALHRPDQLDLRHLHVRADVVRLRREHACRSSRCFSPAGSSSRCSRRR